MYTFLPPRFIQALIHFEAIQSTTKRIDYLDSLVEKVIVPNTEKATVVSASMREELSSIFFERKGEKQGMYARQSQAREEVETLCEEDEDEHGDTLCGHVMRTMLQMNFGFAVIFVRNGSTGNLLYEEMLQFISFLVVY
ncbi:pre-mRNA-processing factor 39 isoform X3 [Cucumis melo var. makuwa]|uniref:Pre-mRNA-processing factor 39 isoform X3 n=1 Tax=Cucumis melo var. makuwa TaxID=1194695 RepID=A0A5D3BAP5_CUCMM|nr:pre-mRNA-processing factor 39 isoform X3 [Cucumis melo var. makuwa]TYJ96187.1 pre-mRNA-processing factor 39 isoform X3 [Cucumis melo var. makuwa]